MYGHHDDLLNMYSREHITDVKWHVSNVLKTQNTLATAKKHPSNHPHNMPATCHTTCLWWWYKQKTHTTELTAGPPWSGSSPEVKDDDTDLHEKPDCLQVAGWQSRAGMKLKMWFGPSAVRFTMFSDPQIGPVANSGVRACVCVYVRGCAIPLIELMVAGLMPNALGPPDERRGARWDKKSRRGETLAVWNKRGKEVRRCMLGKPVYIFLYRSGHASWRHKWSCVLIIITTNYI